MSRRSDETYLWDMRLAAERVCRHVRGRTYAEYENDELLRDAVERAVQIIGEAAWKITPQTRDRNPQTPWTPIIAQRHRLVHDYEGILAPLIWEVATRHAPELIAMLIPLTQNPLPDSETQE